MSAGLVDLSTKQRDLVLAILRAHLPNGARVWVFGSRANGCAKPFSDLDLAIDAGRELTLDEMGVLSEAFSECDLPWKVDLLDWQAIDKGFARQIESGRVALI